MKKQLVIIGIVAILVCISLSGCNQVTDSGIDIKLINNCDEDIHVTVYITGNYINNLYQNLTPIVTSNTVDMYIAAGGEKSAHFDNLRMEFENQNNADTAWTVWVKSNLGHDMDFNLQHKRNDTSPSVLQYGTTLIFHEDGTVGQE